MLWKKKPKSEKKKRVVYTFFFVSLFLMSFKRDKRKEKEKLCCYIFTSFVGLLICVRTSLKVVFSQLFCSLRLCASAFFFFSLLSFNGVKWRESTEVVGPRTQYHSGKKPCGENQTEENKTKKGEKGLDTIINSKEDFWVEVVSQEKKKTYARAILHFMPQKKKTIKRAKTTI